MILDEPINTLPKLVYVNFYPSPHILDKELKLKVYRNAFDFLFLLKDNFQITVFDFIGITSSFIKQDITFNFLKNLSTSKLKIPWTLFKKIRKLNPEVVYIQGLGYPHYIILLKWFLKSNTKILVHDHANAIPNKAKHFIFKWADSYINKYFFTSKQVAKPWIKTGLISSESKIVECVEGSTHFTNNSKIKKEKNTFIWVGRLDQNKDPMTVLKAFKEFLVTTKATLTMFFKETELLQEIENFIQTYSLENSVLLHGAVANEALEYWYQKSEYFLLGSFKEGGSYSLIEAMACGCIPIVSNIPVHQKMLNNEKCGFYFEPGNTKSLLSVLENLKEKNLKDKRTESIHYFKENMSHQAIASIITQASV